MNLGDEIKNSYKNSNILLKLIYINIGVFLFIKLFDLVLFLFNINETDYISVVNWLAVPAYFNTLIFKPWTPVTYMFVHRDVLHILFNLLWLYWLGIIFLQYLKGRQLLGVYLLGGLSGAFLYILAYNVFPVFRDIRSGSIAFGASASVMAVVVAICTYQPNYAIQLFLIGPVKLKYMAVFTVMLDLLSIPSGNAGGHIAHLGGAIFGFIFANQIQHRRDITYRFTLFLDNLEDVFKNRPKTKMKVTHKNKDEILAKNKSDLDYNKRKYNEQQEIDRILDKISKSGYNSLTKEEKELLFKQSEKK
jgi:membrane associated rhomboid family serine protease